MKLVAKLVGGILRVVTFAKGLATFKNELLAEVAKVRELLSDLVSVLKDLAGAFS
jgi:hypothetical protein